MAWVITLSLLLAVLIRTILTHHYIMKEGDVYEFNIHEYPDYCLFYRNSAEENLLLWNLSNPSPENTLTAEFRGRLRLRKGEDGSVIQINNLTQSDSGQYWKECWRNGEKDQYIFDLLVCSHVNEWKDQLVYSGQTVELQCDGTRDDDTMTVQWYKRRSKLSETSSILHLNITIRDWARFTTSSMYQCALMEEQFCVSYQHFYLYIKKPYVVVSVGEEAVLSCFNHDDRNGTETRWDQSTYSYMRDNYGLMWNSSPLSRAEKQRYVTDGRTTGNYSLVFTSLMLNHTGVYRCDRSDDNKTNIIKQYELLVFLKSESDLLTEFFSEGEEVVLRCNSNITEYNWVVWFRRTAEVQHVILDTFYEPPFIPQNLEGRINASGSFVILSNLSLKDTGEYWCGLFYDNLCVSVTKTLLLEWEPFGIISTFYRVYSKLMGCALLGMVCAMITVILRNRRRNQASLKTRRTAVQTERQKSSRV